MLPEELLIGLLATLNIIHPLPRSLVQGMLTVFLRVVVPALTICLSQLPVLFLHSLQIALEVRRETELVSLVERPRVESREEEKTGCWSMVRRRPQHLARQQLGPSALSRCHDMLVM